MLLGLVERVRHFGAYGYATRLSALLWSILWCALILNGGVRLYPVAVKLMASTPAVNDLAVIDGQGVFTCTSQETLYRAVEMVSQKDKAAFMQVMSEAYAAGACQEIDANAEVVIVERAPSRTVTKIRRSGSMAETWVLTNFLRSQRHAQKI